MFSKYFGFVNTLGGCFLVAVNHYIFHPLKHCGNLFSGDHKCMYIGYSYHGHFLQHNIPSTDVKVFRQMPKYFS